MKTKVFEQYLAQIANLQNRERTQEVLRWVAEKFPQLAPRVAWNQPMFTDHGTFILGFSVSIKHLAVSPEREGVVRFFDEIQRSGYESSNSMMLFRIGWNRPVDYALLERIIAFNIAEKADCSTFWRK